MSTTTRNKKIPDRKKKKQKKMSLIKFDQIQFFSENMIMSVDMFFWHEMCWFSI